MPLKLQVVDLLDKRDVLVEDPLVLFLEVSLIVLQLASVLRIPYS